MDSETIKGHLRRHPAGGAFDAFVSHVYGDLKRRACCRLGNQEDAAECLQDVFLDVFGRKIDYLLEADDAAAALMDLVNKACADRQRRPSCRHECAWPEGGEPLDPPAPEPDEHDPLGQLPRVQQALGRLTPEERQLIHLRHTCELGHQEIGKAIGVGAVAARQRYSRAVKRLRDFLGPP